MKESSQRTQCITARCVWGQSADADPCPALKASTMSMWASALHHGAVEEGGLVWRVVFSFYIMWMAMCMCIVYLGKRWHQEALWEEGKLAEAVYALGNVLLGNPRSGVYVDVTLICTTCLNTVANKVHPFVAVVSFSEIIGLATLQQSFRNSLTTMTKSSRCCPGLQIFQISLWSSITWMCRKNEFDPWRPNLTTNRT